MNKPRTKTNPPSDPSTTKTNPPLDPSINISNALTRAGHGLTLPEKRLVFLAIAHMDSREPVPKKADGEPALIASRVHASEYARTFHVDIDTAYAQMKSAGKKLYERSITFYEPAFKRNGVPLPKTIRTMRWIGEAGYQAGEGWIELIWWPKLVPHLRPLKDHFTSMKLSQTAGLRSAYSWRLLELLMRFKSSGWAEYTIEDFLCSMDAPPKAASDFGVVRRRIIEPAIKELALRDGLLIQFTTRKAGRKVAAVRFDFVQTNQPDLFNQ